MNRVIAIFFTLIYLPFVTAAVWPEGDNESSLMHHLQGKHHYGFITDDGFQHDATSDVVLAEPLNHVAKHITGAAKRKVPRTGTAGYLFKNVASRSAIAYHHATLSSATQPLYYGSIFLKNGVLRI